MSTIYDPDWAPLVALVGAQAAHKFMYIGTNGSVRLYKHIDNRRYLNVDPELHAWRLDPATHNYIQIDRTVALANVELTSATVSVTSI